MISSKILFTPQENFNLKDLKINIENSNLRIKEEIRVKIEEIWQELKSSSAQNGKLLYNGLSWRLNSIKGLSLNIAAISFKERRSLELMIDQLDYNDTNQIGMGLAIGSLIKTADNYYIFGQRSGKTQAISKVDIIGGIFENMDIKDSSDLTNTLFEEMEQEACIKTEDIEDCQLLGIIGGNRGNVIIVFHSVLNKSRDEIEQTFDKNNDKEEMSGMIFVPKSQLNAYLERRL
jgi:hypothetical protein